MHCMYQSRVESGTLGSRRQTRPRRPMRRRRAWKEGREETAGSSYSLLTLPASLSSRRQAERTSDDRAGCFCGVFELFVQTVNKYILYYSRRLLLHGQASKHEQRVARFMVSASSSVSRPLQVYYIINRMCRHRDLWARGGSYSDLCGGKFCHIACRRRTAS